VWNSSTVVFVASSWIFVAPSSPATTETERYSVQQRFPTWFYGGRHTIIFHIPKNETKTKGQFLAAEITPVLPTAGQNFPRYFEWYLEFFPVFQKCYSFTLRFLSEPLTRVGRNPGWETVAHIIRERGLTWNTQNVGHPSWNNSSLMLIYEGWSFNSGDYLFTTDTK